jgi:DNA repair protein RadD
MLRPYQARAIEALRGHVRAGLRRVCLVCPTGGGKTVVAASIIRSAVENFGARVLFLAHRRELVGQTYVHLQREGITAGVMRGDDSRTDPSLPVQVGTIQTVVRRDRPPADIVFVDEAHRAPGDSYAAVLASYPDATIIGLTATPCRLDGKPLGEHFDAMECVASYSELIADGYISAPLVYAARALPDLSAVPKRHGDYAEGVLEKAMLEPHVVGDVVAEWGRLAKRRPTVVFACGIEHSKALVERFTDAGVRAAHLDGTTSDDERFQTLMQVENGKLDVVSNVGVLTEGWDQPRVKCCVMARPTLSLSLYMQCVGRILRPWESVVPLVLDHSGNTDRHGLPHEDREWSLDTGVIRVRPKTPYHLCASCFAYVTQKPCELCGAVPDVRPRERREAQGTMAVVADAVTDPERFFFERHWQQARTKGFKPGYASAQFKEKFGRWPTWAWSQECKAAFAADPEWRERQEKRERERAWWQEQQAERAPDEPEHPWTPEQEGAFDDLLS